MHNIMRRLGCVKGKDNGDPTAVSVNILKLNIYCDLLGRSDNPSMLFFCFILWYEKQTWSGSYEGSSGKKRFPYEEEA